MANPNPSPKTRFKKGTSGNPGGRPKGLRERIRQEIGEDGDEAVRMLLKALRGRKVRPDQFKAAQDLLDRGFGKATQPMEHDIPRRKTIFEFTEPINKQ